jgi:hypothetical protein
LLQKNFLLKMADFSFETIEDSFTSFVSTTSSTSSSKKKGGGRSFSEVWQHVSKGKETSRGHYEGTCNYCKVFWKIAKPSSM